MVREDVQRKGRTFLRPLIVPLVVLVIRLIVLAVVLVVRARVTRREIEDGAGVDGSAQATCDRMETRTGRPASR